MKCYILKRGNDILSLLFEDNKCIEILHHEITGRPSIGQLFIGRCKDVRQNIGAAFVDIGADRNAYLPFSEIDENTIFTKKQGKALINEGDELMVRVVKEDMGIKPAAVSGKLNISGKYTVLINDTENKIHTSKKLKGIDEKEQIITEALTEEKGYSYIIRTNAGPAGPETVIKDAQRLKAAFDGIKEHAAFRTAPSLLYSPPASYLTYLRDQKCDALTEIITDDKDIYDDICCWKDALELCDVKLYTDAYPLKSLLSLSSLFAEVKGRVSWMKSGAYLVIEQTEALVSIDVNSGKAEAKKDRYSFYKEINLEAAKEAARQIRLRNLSGMILIDFINMKDDEDRAEVLKCLQNCFSSDPLKAYALGFTKLGLAEVTREKRRENVFSMPLDRFLDQ